jgi:hypothetical protein
VGDMVYIKLQPFRHTAFGLHQNLKLTIKYYEPFMVMEKIKPAVYKIQLPASTSFYHLGPKAVPQTNLPPVTSEGYFKTEPTTVLETRALPRNDDIIT